MHCRLPLSLGAALVAGSFALHAQDPVSATSDPEALFHSSDAKLNTNKQAAYHIVRDLLEAGDWELADKRLTERDSQDKPNTAAGRTGVVEYFPEGRKVKPLQNPDKLQRQGEPGAARVP